MNGKLVGGFIVATALIAGAALYYLQVHHWYDEVQADAVEIELTLLGGAPEAILAENIEAIDASSSPIRFRACFDTPQSQAMLTETYESYDDPVPLIAPDWFGCFDAEAIGAALEEGAMLPFLGVANIEYGIDRVVAISEDGKGYAWNQINRCGKEVFDGNPPPPGCPPRPTPEE